MNSDSVSHTSQLPNAPLTEVVFEMRWRLEGAKSIPIPFKNDPGFYVMADRFAMAASQHGFRFARKLSADPQATPHAISWRFYKQQEQPFPLWQIGPGILAVNESASYEWNSYKKLCLDAARTLIRCYPKMHKFRLEPFYLELRYLDSFSLDEKVNENLVGFLNNSTSLSLALPTFVPGRLKDLANGQLILSSAVKGMGETLFVVIVGTGVSQGIKSVIMESKVLTKLSETSIGRGQFVTELGRWLGNAHNITSPFFKEFIKEHLMKKFTGS